MFRMDSLRSNAFSWPQALSLAAASKLAYEQSGAIKSVTRDSWGFAQCEFLSMGDTQGFVASTSDVTLVSFRGTESLGDWLGNLDIFRTEWPPQGSVHQGFLQAFELVRGQVKTLLADYYTDRLWVTGHSLGGALAAIAAAELGTVGHIAGVHTFGQPRLGDERVAEFFKTHFAGRFFRFVNNDDLVTRVPPGFSHVGRLIRFDAEGNVQDPATESDAATLERPSLTVERFEEIKREIRQVDALLEATGTNDRAAKLDTSIEGLLPGISDHKMDRYIAAIRRQSDAAAVEASTLSVEATGSEGIESDAILVANRRRSSPVLIRLKKSRWIAPEGIKVNTHRGTVVSAQATMEAVEALRTNAGVASVEISRDAGKTELASSVPFVGGDWVHKPPIAEDGGAALIGIIDTGVDVLHETFLDAAGNSRILAIWNQRDNSGQTPKEIDPAGFTQDYGTLYVAADIMRFLSGPETPPEALRDPQAHGTHVASIAAGRGSAASGLAEGMAPAARLVVVIPHMRTGPSDPPSLGYSASHVDALDFLKRVAGGGTAVLDKGLPIAVNVSLGMNAGAHDGSSTLEAAFDQMSGGGRDPGFVIVKSAGNERSHHGHVRTGLALGIVTIAWTSNDEARPQDYIEVWYDSLDELEFQLIDPNNNTSTLIANETPSLKQPLGNSFCEMELTELHPDNGATRLRIALMPQPGKSITAGKWQLRVRGQRIRSRDAVIDAWVERDRGRAVSFLNSDDSMTLSIPGTARTVITVGACHSREPMELTSTSSHGKTRDGRAKPDLCAPGAAIKAAAAGTKNGVRCETGTSMAAPMVTGALALVLSHRQKQAGQPQWNARQLHAALIRSTRNFTGVHNDGFGYGMLDTKRLFDSLL